MLPTDHDVSPQGSRLLASLPKKEYICLLPQLKPITLTFGEVLYESGDTISHVYFPNDAIVALLSTVEERSALQIGMVGNEGMVGVSVLMGVNKSPTRALVQGTGSAMRMTSAAVQFEAQKMGNLHQLLQHYIHSLLTQVCQLSACNRFHALDARLARWLLMICDRTGSNEFRLTQEFIADMLGARREGVNKTIGAMQKRGIIEYSRAQLKILDATALQRVSCNCYDLIKAENDSFLN